VGFCDAESEAKERAECRAYNVVKPAYDGTGRDRTYAVVGKVCCVELVWILRTIKFSFKTHFHHAQIPFQRDFTVQQIMESNYSGTRLKRHRFIRYLANSVRYSVVQINSSSLTATLCF